MSCEKIIRAYSEKTLTGARTRKRAKKQLPEILVLLEELAFFKSATPVPVFYQQWAKDLIEKIEGAPRD